MNMATRYASLLLLSVLTLPVIDACAQASLTAIDAPLTIDFFTTVPGVNNAVFGADSDMGQAEPWPGQLDTDAWDYFADGSTANAVSNAATFPGTLPTGNGYAEGGAFATGVNATDVNGQRCFGIQPTGGHFTAGALTLRVQNNTGAPVTQLAVAYTVQVFNDLERSNRFGFLYSIDNTAGSYVAVPGADVISPAGADAEPTWEMHQVAFTINGITVPDGGFIHLRWMGDDISGSGQRDEFALTAIELTAQVASGPGLLASTTGLPAFSQALGTPSASQSFTVSGTSLGGEVAITVPVPFQVSLTEGSGYVNNIELDPVGGTLAGTPVYVRLNNTVAGPASGAVTISSAGANTLTVNLSGTTASTGLPTLYINELLASNATGITDENGEYDDWFEIFNPNAFDVDLAGWYVSDDPAQITRYQFDPAGMDAVAPAQGWLLVWADNQTAQGNLHTNFALSASGESIILTAADGATIVDQVEFGPQDPDESYGRQSDGGTPWVTFTAPTPGASNNVVGIAERAGRSALRAWPVPVTGGVVFLDRQVTATLHDVDGRTVGAISRSNTADLSGLAPGTYLLRTDDGIVLRLVRP